MTVVSEQVHPLGLDFANQRKVVVRRDVHKESWPTIARKVRNLQNKQPSATLVARYYKGFSARLGRRKSRYAKCGRKPWKVSKEIEAYVVARLRALRRQCVCTSSTLQREVAANKHVSLEASTIRKILAKKGYHWLTRAQKRKYSAEDMAARLAFAKKVAALSAAQLRERLSLAMDGVVLGLPPTNPIDRENYCRHGDAHMWRKRSEAANPDLAGGSKYGDQLPLARALPLWGGVSEGGFAVVAIHENKKMTADEFVEVVRKGKLTDAIRRLNPIKPDGPWFTLCDNESFLRKAKATKEAVAEQGVSLWHIPPRSPDLNPVEKFWAWLRRELRRLDLQDLSKKKRPLSKSAYAVRVRSLCGSQKAQRVASNFAKGLKRVCNEVIAKKGAASSG
jgi:hypothetical protein